MAGIIAIARGDDVRVKFATHDGYVNHMAVVTRLTDTDIYVRFASGFRYRVGRHENRCEKVMDG